jgi:DNA polymerase III epsilon subunit family exonuclease
MLSDILNDNISDIEFSFLDVETTGLNPLAGDKICEVAILKTRGLNFADSYETLVNPGIEIPTSATAIHGITGENVKDAPYFLDIAEQVQRFLKNSVIVAHNAKFDLKFLDAELNFTSDLTVNNIILDTLGIARRFYSFPSNNLGKIAKSLGIPISGYHRAMADVEITKDVFEYFTRDLSRRGIRVNILKDLIRIQGGGIKITKPADKILPKVIEDALINKAKLEIKYLSPFSDSVKNRVIEPLDVLENRTNTYIIAYCHLRRQKCNFRLDRILEISTVN